MKPKRRRTGRAQPDAIKDEIVETIGGTDGELRGDDDAWGSAGKGEREIGYGAPKEQSVEEEDLI